MMRAVQKQSRLLVELLFASYRADMAIVEEESSLTPNSYPFLCLFSGPLDTNDEDHSCIFALRHILDAFLPVAILVLESSWATSRA
jgi:hypothetical protein